VFSLSKIFYFCLAFFLNSEGFTELGFFQTPTRDRTDKYLCLVSLCIRFEVGILDNLSLLDIHTLSN
jgi:hypothetical protein